MPLHYCSRTNKIPEKKENCLFNKWDTCCFSNDLYKIYEADIKKKLTSLGKGTFENYFDDTYRGHKISKFLRKETLMIVSQNYKKA